VFGYHLGAVLGADPGRVQENVHLESRDRMWAKTNRSAVNRAQGIVDDPVCGLNVRSLAVGSDNAKLPNPGADLHYAVADAMQAVLRESVHRLLHGAQLIGRVLIKDG